MTFWVAGAVVGSALIGAGSSKSAAKTQTQAATQSADLSKQISDDQIALQREQFAAQKALEREQFEYQKSLQAPFQQAGVNALGRMQAGEFAQPGAFKFGAGTG
jgi:outer membrane murein-binding lipoprotein Lpp